MFTETDDLETELDKLYRAASQVSAASIFSFSVLGPEAEAASHLCYIKPGSGAKLYRFCRHNPYLLEHTSSTIFRSSRSAAATSPRIRRGTNAEMRQYILTLGPAAIYRHSTDRSVDSRRVHRPPESVHSFKPTCSKPNSPTTTSSFRPRSMRTPDCS